jgi:uncharacterized protein YigE (DUF2233 family)
MHPDEMLLAGGVPLIPESDTIFSKKYCGGRIILTSPFLLALCLMMCRAAVSSAPLEWTAVDSCLWTGAFEAPQKARVGDSKITAIRFDTRIYTLKLLCATEFDSVNCTAREWCRNHNLIAAVNAGMYAKDYRTHIGYMKNFKYINNARVAGSYKAFVAMNPKSPQIPEVRIFDLTCDPLATFKDKYNTLVQNLRMVSCTRTNVWSAQQQRSSIACLATDSAGRVLILFSESPWQVNDFIDMLLKLPLGINRALYLEGGAPASLYFNYKGTVIAKNGIYETGDDTQRTFSLAYPLPNVFGVVKKK